MALEDQIAAKAKEIHTDGYPMSLGEVLSLYREGDIDIHPEFQRIFRWDSGQKSRLIESILLGIPIPPIFVSQRDDGVWDVIDGVQRLSTVLEFVGIYRDHEGAVAPASTLEATEYLPDLAGYKWQDSGDGGTTFSAAMQRDVKRAKLEFRIIRKESDPNAKYDLFQRLNSGAHLSPQESRNCLLVMLNVGMYETLSSLSSDPAFRGCVPISESKESQAYRQELVLRFFCQADYNGTDAELPEEYGDYITRWMRSAAATFPSSKDRVDVDLFRRTFALLNSALGENAFRRYDGSRHLGPFSIACFEFVTSGVAAHLPYWEEHKSALVRRVQDVWSSPDFRNNSGTGVSPRRRVPRLVLRSRKHFAS